MIIDQVSQFSAYFQLHPLLPLLQDFVDQVDITNLPTGHHEISGENLFVNVAQMPGRIIAEAPLEVHDNYWDVHWLLSGVERFGWRARSTCLRPRDTFDEAKDMQLFDDEPETWFSLVPGQFALFMPQDAHAPLVVSDESSSEIHKLVFKLKQPVGLNLS